MMTDADIEMLDHILTGEKVKAIRRYDEEGSDDVEILFEDGSSIHIANADFGWEFPAPKPECIIRLFTQPRRWWNANGIQCKWKSNATPYTKAEAEAVLAKLKKNYPEAVIQPWEPKRTIR
jgi:hypothetical protein